MVLVNLLVSMTLLHIYIQFSFCGKIYTCNLNKDDMGKMNRNTDQKILFQVKEKLLLVGDKT